MFFAVVVRIIVRQMTNRSFALHLHIVFGNLDIEARLGRVFHIPNHHSGDFDRVALLVVYLELAPSKFFARSEIFFLP